VLLGPSWIYYEVWERFHCWRHHGDLKMKNNNKSVVPLLCFPCINWDFVSCTFTPIFASQGLRFGSPFSPSLADLEYILRIRALKFHWLRLPVHVSNQKTFYTEHMLSTKCKQRWHRNALTWQRFATSRFGSNENIFPICQSFETFNWLTVSASKLNWSQISFSSLGAAILLLFVLSTIRLVHLYIVIVTDTG
jgi:hypothetical protein